MLVLFKMEIYSFEQVIIIKQIVFFDFIHRLVSQEQTKLFVDVCILIYLGFIFCL
jgi:hypothetical protein